MHSTSIGFPDSGDKKTTISPSLNSEAWQNAIAKKLNMWFN